MNYNQSTLYQFPESIKTPLIISFSLHLILILLLLAQHSIFGDHHITPGYKRVYVETVIEKKVTVAPKEKKNRSPLAKQVKKSRKTKPKSFPKVSKKTAAKNKKQTKGDEHILREYTDRLVGKIYESWNTALIDISYKKRDPVLKFDIHRDGSVANIDLLVSSGSIELDNSAILAIKTAQIEPLPNSFKESLMKIRFKFEYSQLELNR